MTSLVPNGAARCSATKDEQAVDTFAPNSHATSKIVLAQIPEEDLIVRTGEENLDLMTGDDTGPKLYQANIMDSVIKQPKEAN